MRLQILLIPLLQVALAESLSEVSAYLGDTVTLSSGVDPLWTLNKVVWSIFLNTTWIATYYNGMINVDRVNQYKGRLSLNKTSGDLMICHLTQNDAMEYRVDLINSEGLSKENKIKLIVQKRLQKPNIKTQAWLPNTSTKGGCWMEVHCSSPDPGINLSCHSNPPAVTTLKNPVGNSALLLVFLNTTQNPVEITCVSSRNMEYTSSAVNKTCEDDKLQPLPQPKPQPQPQPQPQPRSRHVLVFFIGVLIGVVTTIIITILFGEQIKKTWENFKGRR